MVSVTTTGFGSAAIEALGRLLEQRRGPDPLAPALVVCAHPMAAVATRRALGARPGGVAAVTVTTGDQLMDELVTPALARLGAHRGADAEIHALVRAELEAEPGAFGPVRDHRATEQRLVALHHQLAGLDDDDLARLASVATGLAADGLRLMRRVRRRSATVLGATEVLDLALDELERLPAGARGPIVVFLPEPVTAVESRLLQALASRADCDVVVGLTGSTPIDRRHAGRLAACSVQVPVGGGELGGQPINTATLIEVSDPDDEVRAALNDVTAHGALGVPLNRMAVLYPSSDPYATLLTDHLDAADLPWCGPPTRPLSASVAGRFLLGLLDLAGGGLTRQGLLSVLALAPVLDGGRAVPALTWDRLARQAGVVDGESWDGALADLVHHVGPDDGDEVRRLRAFVRRLGEELEVAQQPGPWPDRVAWLLGRLDTYLDWSPLDEGPPGGGGAGRPDWPEQERVAADLVRAAIGALDQLDSTGPRAGEAVSIDAVASIVAAELDRCTVPNRPLGHGLFVGPIASAAGLAFERVIVIGLAEGLYPRSPVDDSLLPDRVRAASGGLLAPSEIGPDLDARAIAACLAGSRQTPVVVQARGDLRTIRARSWPRQLDPLVDERVVLPSHHRVLADHGRPAAHDEFGLRALIGHVDGGDPVHTHELAHLDPVLATNLDRVRHRSRPELNRFVGRIPAGTLDATERLLSATALEAYAACPRSYLLGRVLRLGLDDRPERMEEITPPDRGTLVHAVLERFIAECLELDLVPAPGEPWSAERGERLFAILDEELASAQARGITGGRVNTIVLGRRLRAEMARFIETDNELRADRGSTPLTVEIGFGIDDEPSEVALPDGRSVRLRGRVDRVDATEDGGLLVIDYKGGSGRAFAGLADDPLDGGRRLQLPLYARVVAQKLGRDGPRTALYWLTRFGDLKPVELEDELEDELDRTVGAALDGIANGLFPGVPGEAVGWPRLTFANCRYCDFDRICPTDRQREWEGVRDDDRLSPVEILLTPVGPVGEV